MKVSSKGTLLLTCFVFVERAVQPFSLALKVDLNHLSGRFKDRKFSFSKRLLNSHLTGGGVCISDPLVLEGGEGYCFFLRGSCV